MPKKANIYLLYTLFLLLLPLNMWGQKVVSIQARLDRAEMLTGEQAVIDVTMRTDNLPQTKFYIQEDIRKGEPFVVVQFTPTDTTELGGGLQEIKAKLVITSFDSTLITIPPIIIETPSGQDQTEPMALNIIQPEVDATHPENFKPIKDPLDLEFSLRDVLEMLMRSYVFWGGLLLVVLVYTYYRFVASRRLREEVKPMEEVFIPMVTPLEEALQRLSLLEASDPSSQEEFKVYYSDLVETLKLYIDTKLSVHTMDMTSKETLRFLEDRGEVHSEIATIRAVLVRADMSKFARSLPSLGEAQDSLRETKRFVLEAEERWTVRETAPLSQISQETSL